MRAKPNQHDKNGVLPDRFGVVVLERVCPVLDPPHGRAVVFVEEGVERSAVVQRVRTRDYPLLSEQFRHVTAAVSFLGLKLTYQRFSKLSW